METPVSAYVALATLAARLLAYSGAPVGLHLRTAEELETVLGRNPFKQMRPDRTVAFF